jgi:hypothetical protein
MGFERQFRRRARSREDFDADLAFISEVERRSKERMAKSGEKPHRVVVRVDEKHHDISIAAVDPPAEGRQQ